MKKEEIKQPFAKCSSNMDRARISSCKDCEEGREMFDR